MYVFCMRFARLAQDFAGKTSFGGLSCIPSLSQRITLQFSGNSCTPAVSFRMLA